MLSISACALGVGGLIGWWQDIAILRTISPSFVPINPVTAVCLVLCGLAVILSQLGDRSFRSTYAPWLLVAAFVFFGVGRALSILSGFDFGVDLILFRQKMPAPGPAALGRMAIGTAVNFILLGCALLFLNSRSRRLWSLSEWLIALALGITFVPLANYLYNSTLGTTSGSSGPMDLPTILGFLGLCLAVLFSQPHRTQAMTLLTSETGGGRIARQILPVMIPLLFGSNYFVELGAQRGLYEAQVALTLDALVAISCLVTVVLWNANALRRGDDALLAAHRDLEQQVRERTRELSTANSNLKKINRFYLERSQVNQVIVRSRDRQHIFTAVCQIAVSQGLFRMAWIGLIEEGSRRLKPIAWAGIDEGDLEKVGVSLGDTPEGRGLMGAACSESRQIVVNDVEMDPLMIPVRDEVLLRGYRSVAACPLREGEHVLGAIGFYSGESDFFQQDEMRLLEELTEDISFALADIAQEEALLESEQRFRILFEGAMDGIVLVDLETHRLIMANPQMCRMLGSSPDEVHHLSIEDIHPAEDLPLILRDFSAVALGAITTLVEVRVLRQDGTLFPAEVKGRTVEIGKQRLVLGVFRDLTDRKRGEEELRRSEERFRLVWENATNGMRLTDSQGTLVAVNEAFCRIVGKSRAEIEGYPFCAIYALSEQDRILRHYIERFAEGTIPEYLERQMSLWDGRTIWIETSNSFIRTDPSQPLLLGMFRDITERKNAEQRIRILSEAIERSPSLTIITDAQARVEYTNPKFTEVTGYTAEEVVGKNPRFLKSGETPPDEYQKMWRTLSGGSVWRGEFHNLKKSGELYWAEATITPLLNDAGEISHYVGVQEDITERKRMEKEKRMLEEQFRQAQKMEAIGRLAGGIAHDFNNALAVIIGYSDTLSNSLPPENPMRDDLEEILKAGNRAADMTRQLLAFSRKQMLELKVLDLNTTVENLEKMLKRLIGEDIEIALILDPALPRVMADEGQIDQIIMNLTVNARDAMPQGGKLTIETAVVYLDEGHWRHDAKLQPGQYAMIAVSDTGVGMNAETQAHLFEPFFTTKAKGQGTGLGLATIYGIVKQSGGFVWVYSEAGKGSTFKIYLPKVDAQAHEKKSQVLDLESLQGSETVLVVEDSEGLRKLACRILEEHGYCVLSAPDGTEALQIARSQQDPVQLLLTDVVLPGISGRVLSEGLIQIWPSLKVLYMSGYTDNAIVHHGVLEAGIEFLEKPFGPADLLRKVRQVLSS